MKRVDSVISLIYSLSKSEKKHFSLQVIKDKEEKDYLVMIEGKVADENAYVGRTYADAPGIDGYMFINTGELLMSGDFVKAHVTGSLEYDLIGEIADEYTE